MSNWFKMVERSLREHEDVADLAEMLGGGVGGGKGEGKNGKGKGEVVEGVEGALEKDSPEVKAAVVYWVVRVLRLLTVRPLSLPSSLSASLPTIPTSPCFLIQPLANANTGTRNSKSPTKP